MAFHMDMSIMRPRARGLCMFPSPPLIIAISVSTVKTAQSIYEGISDQNRDPGRLFRVSRNNNWHYYRQQIYHHLVTPFGDSFMSPFLPSHHCQSVIVDTEQSMFDGDDINAGSWRGKGANKERNNPWKRKVSSTAPPGIAILDLKAGKFETFCGGWLLRDPALGSGLAQNIPGASHWLRVRS